MFKPLQKLAVMLRWATVCGAIMLAFFAAAQPVDKEPKNEEDWFQRADDQMNLRAPFAYLSHESCLPCVSRPRSRQTRIVADHLRRWHLRGNMGRAEEVAAGGYAGQLSRS